MAARKTYKGLHIKEVEGNQINFDVTDMLVHEGPYQYTRYEEYLETAISNSFWLPSQFKVECKDFNFKIFILTVIQTKLIKEDSYSVELCPRFDLVNTDGYEHPELVVMVRYYEDDVLKRFEEQLYKYFEIDSVENNG